MSVILDDRLRAKRYWLALKQTPQLRNRIYKLVDRFGGPEQAYRLGIDELQALGFTIDAINEIEDFRASYNVEARFKEFADSGIAIITDDDPMFPMMLKKAPGYPQALFITGALSKTFPAVAIVGSRRSTQRGLAMAHELAYDLASSGVVVISGGARGIDTAAHQGALEANGITHAILGCGIDIVYPRENKRLFKNITENGAVISEFPPGTAPLAHNFPIRNRIVAGMCNALIVVEAGIKSGALITADFALDYGRDVCAVPGFTKNEMSKGANRLIKNGAYLIESSQDVLDIMGIDAQPAQRIMALSLQEQVVLDALEWDNKSFDELLQTTKTTFPALSESLLSLELAGLIRKDFGGRFLRIR